MKSPAVQAASAQAMTEAEFNARFGLDAEELEAIAHEYDTDSYPSCAHHSARPGRPAFYETAMRDTHLRLPVDLLEQLDRRAENLGTTRSQLARDLIAEGLAS